MSLIQAGTKLWALKLFIQKLVLVLSSVGFTTLVMMEIIFRYFLFLPLSGIEELATFLAVWTYMIGGAYGAYEKSHISASLIDMLVKKPRVLASLELIVDAITLFISTWMTVWGAQFFSWSVQRLPHSLELRFPLYFVHASIPTGLGLMSFYFTVSFIHSVQRVTTQFRQAQLASGAD